MSRKCYSVAECAKVLDELSPGWEHRMPANKALLDLSYYVTCIVGNMLGKSEKNRRAASEFVNRHFEVETQYFFCDNTHLPAWLVEIDARLGQNISISVDAIKVTIGTNVVTLSQKEAKKLVDLLTKFIA